MNDEQTMGTADQMPSETAAVVEEATVSGIAGEAKSASVPAVVPIKKRWRSKKQMLRSKDWKQHISPLFSPEGQAKLAEEIAEHLYQMHYAKDVSKRVALTEDPPPSDAPFREAIVVPLPQKFWLEKIATLRTTRLQLHVKLKETEDQINAAQQMLDTTRFPPNGHAA